jgi:transposase InsO family protein
LKGEALNWHFGQSLNELTWEKYREAFLQRFKSKDDGRDALDSLLTIKRKRRERTRTFIDRARKLYLRCSEENNVGENEMKRFESNIITRISKQLRGAKRIYFKQVRQQLLLPTLAKFEEIIQDSSSSSGSSESSSSSEDQSKRHRKRNQDRKKVSQVYLNEEPKPSITKSVPMVKPVDPVMIDDLCKLVMDAMKKVDQYSKEMNTKVEKLATDLQQMKPRCGNCASFEHRANFCSMPCRLCGEKHPIFKCPKKTNGKTSFYAHEDNSVDSSDASDLDTFNEYFADEELYPAMSSNSPAQPRTKRKRRSNQHDQQRTAMDIDNAAKIPNVTRHDVEKLPVFDKKHSKADPVALRDPSADPPLDIHKIMNEPIVQVSMKQLADCSRTMRSVMCRELKRSNKTKTPAEKRIEKAKRTGRKHVGDSFKVEVTKLPKGMSAPRTKGRIGKLQIAVVLDGGCTSNLINEDLVLRMGIPKSEWETSTGTFTMADGSQTKAKGIAKFPLTLHGLTYHVKAHIFDVPDYELLLGRRTMGLFKLSTQWKNHQWTIEIDGEEINLPVTYSYDSKLKLPVWTDGYESDSSSTSLMEMSLTAHQELYSMEKCTRERMFVDFGYADFIVPESFPPIRRMGPFDEIKHIFAKDVSDNDAIPDLENCSSSSDNDSSTTSGSSDEMLSSSSWEESSDDGTSEHCDQYSDNSSSSNSPDLDSNEDGAIYIAETVQPETLASMPTTFEDLNETQTQEVLALLHELVDVFATTYGEIQFTNLLKFDVDTGDAKPIKCTPYRLAHVDRQFVLEEIDRLLTQGIIKPANSPWAFPILVATHPRTGKKRLCVDFRKLNSVTKTDPFPIPHLDDVIEKFSTTEWISTLDLIKGFHQIENSEDAIQKLTFVSDAGTYSYLSMPFGPKNGPSTFSRAIALAIGPLPYVTVYIDDITIFSTTFEEHLQHVREILNRLKNASFKINPEKCQFFTKSVELFGFRLSNGGLEITSERKTKIQNLETPQNRHDVRVILGILGPLQRYVNNFATIAAPITDTLKGKGRFKWSKECDDALTKLKNLVQEAPMLRLPDFTKTFCVYTDASKVGLGAVLAQSYGNEDLPVLFISRKLQAAERNYSTTEQELLAVVFACKHLRRFLLGTHFTLYSDHLALKFLFNKPDPLPRLARWIMVLQEFSFEVKHIPGLQNGTADCLSRFPRQDSCNGETWEDFLPAEPLLLLERTSPAYEDNLQTIVNWKSSLSVPNDATPQFWKEQEKYVYVHGMLFRQHKGNLYLVPRLSERSQIIQNAHILGHYGVKSIESIIRQNHWWPTLNSDVCTVVKGCHDCQLFQQQPNSGLTRTLQLTKPMPIFKRFQLDYVTKLPLTDDGNTCILLAVEMHTKWPIAKAYFQANGNNSVQFLQDEIISVFGPPTEIQTDNGTHFVNRHIRELCHEWDIKHIRSSPYHPMSQGAVERLNRTILLSLRRMTYRVPTKWDKYLQLVLHSYRIHPHEATRVPPFQALFGIMPNSNPMLMQLRHSLMTHETREIDFEHMRKFVSRNLQQYYDSITARELYSRLPLSTLEVGDLVLRQDTRQHTPKFSPRWTGPFRVVSRPAHHSYNLRSFDGLTNLTRVHRDLLKPYTFCDEHLPWIEIEDPVRNNSLELLALDSEVLSSSDDFSDSSSSSGTLVYDLPNEATNSLASERQQLLAYFRHYGHSFPISDASLDQFILASRQQLQIDGGENVTEIPSDDDNLDENNQFEAVIHGIEPSITLEHQ